MGPMGHSARSSPSSTNSPAPSLITYPLKEGWETNSAPLRAPSLGRAPSPDLRTHPRSQASPQEPYPQPPPTSARQRGATRGGPARVDEDAGFRVLDKGFRVLD
jgi:hypothetical protein